MCRGIAIHLTLRRRRAFTVPFSPSRQGMSSSAAAHAAAPDDDTADVRWWERDEVNLVAAMLDGPSLGAFASTCCSMRATLKSRDTLRWIAALRGLDESSGLSSVEHIDIAESMASCASAIFFGWGSMTVDASAHESLQKVARLLSRHKSLSVSIDAHCGLEARYAMPLPGQAREFTRDRGEAVREALVQQAVAAGVQLDESRVQVRAWGCSRPLHWCFGQPMSEPFDPERASKNRRVELYLRGDGFEVPKRRRRSEIPRPPGEPPLEDVFEEEEAALAEEGAAADEGAAATEGAAPRAAASVARRTLKLDDDDDDGTADAAAPPDTMMSMELPDGSSTQISIATVMAHLARLQAARNGSAFLGDEDYDDDDDDSEGDADAGEGSMSELS